MQRMWYCAQGARRGIYFGVKRLCCVSSHHMLKTEPSAVWLVHDPLYAEGAKVLLETMCGEHRGTFTDCFLELEETKPELKGDIRLRFIRRTPTILLFKCWLVLWTVKHFGIDSRKLHTMKNVQFKQYSTHIVVETKTVHMKTIIKKLKSIDLVLSVNFVVFASRLEMMISLTRW